MIQEKAIEALEQNGSKRIEINQIEQIIVYALEEAEDSITIQMHNNQVWNYEMIKAPQAWNITQVVQA